MKPPHELLLGEPHLRQRWNVPSAFRVYERPGRLGRSARSLFVVSSASGLDTVATTVTAANKRHCLRLLLIHSDVDPTWLPQMLERAGLRSIRNVLVHEDPTLPRRVLRAWALGAQDDLIAKATVIADRLLVLTCAAQKLELAFDQLRPLSRMPAAERSRFTVADDGSYLHWPEKDIHLDIDSIRSVLDPEAAQRASAKKIAHDQAFSAAIKTLRESVNVAQTAVGDLSERQVRRIERGEGMSVSSLSRYASGLGMTLPIFLDRVAQLAESARQSESRKIA